MPRRRRSVQLLTALLCGGAAACASGDDGVAAGAAQADGPPDELPVMRNAELPFHYPPALYARKVQANVTLRLYIDSAGVVHPESTTVAQSSGYPELDTAAVTGARALSFTPARRDGQPVGVAVRFPILFRHPEAAPVPGDTVLQGRGTRDDGAPARPSSPVPRP